MVEALIEVYKICLMTDDSDCKSCPYAVKCSEVFETMCPMSEIIALELKCEKFLKEIK